MTVLTGGISFGNSTSFVMTALPFSIGHSISTFETCSQRSAFVLTSLIKPYLTCRSTYAPASIFSFTVPTASIVSVFPLFLVSASALDMQRDIVLKGRIWGQINVLQLKDIVAMIGLAEGEGVLAGDSFSLIVEDLLTSWKER